MTELLFLSWEKYTAIVDGLNSTHTLSLTYSSTDFFIANIMTGVMYLLLILSIVQVIKLFITLIKREV